MTVAAYRSDLDALDRLPVALAVAARFGAAVTQLHGVRRSLRPGGALVVCRCAGESGVCTQSAPGLHPSHRSWRNSATSAGHVLARFGQDRPHDNFGLVTGVPSGVVVLDVRGADGAFALARAEADLGPLPATAGTRFGEHRQRWFRVPDDSPMPWGSTAISAPWLGDGLTLLAEGDTAPLPRSVVLTGETVVWSPSPSMTPIAALPPAWLARLVLDGGAPRQRRIAPSVRRFARRA